MKNILISTDYVTLGQFLKMIDFIQSGGEAKNFLLNHQVKVDNEVEQRRGRKLYPLMKVEIDGEVFKVITQ